MNTPSFKEDHISQIPALQFLINLGFEYLSPEEALILRGGKTTNVLFEGVLKTQLQKFNNINYKDKVVPFSEQNIQKSIQLLKDYPLQDGYIEACRYIYNKLILGVSLEQNINGDKKSYNLNYINWDEPKNNIFHVTEELSVKRIGRQEHYRSDIVLYINGIPVCIIECKRPDIKDPLKQAISQHIRNQQEDGIKQLYVYAQILLSITSNNALYGTNRTEEKLWAVWRTKFTNTSKKNDYFTELSKIKNKKLTEQQNNKLFGERYKYVQNYFTQLSSQEILTTIQDEYLYNLCSPLKLMDFIHNFIIFDDNIKKIARYQQYYAIKKTVERIKKVENGKRKGGVIWHTQGSGKSLTMVMLAQAIVLEKLIKNPKIILVTDRVDLDRQITDTFKKCKISVLNASTGANLIELLDTKSDAVITTVINKFENALKNTKNTFTSENIFVLIDEGHRTQYGSFNATMKRVLPNACYIAMTGTPLLKKEKSTAAKFGGIIDSYTIDEAVPDGAVVPLLYEGRHGLQYINGDELDNYFDKISLPLTKKQRADLKKKYSKADQINSAENVIIARAWDISIHFKENWQGTGFKAQLVCDKKTTAIKYKKHLDEIGYVTSEVVISPPDDREGEEDIYEESQDIVKRFWHKIMNEYGTPVKYETTVISRFKNQDTPEIIIVVDKLLTGFDAPRNIVLYLTRNLQEHSLLQAIARVNRVYSGKDFGYIIDYYGVLENLDCALKKYAEMAGYNEEDLKGTLTPVLEEIKKIPQYYSNVWDIFKTINNKKDNEQFEILLRDEAIRVNFYDRISKFARALKLGISTVEFFEMYNQKEIDRYKKDLAFFLNLRSSVSNRYSDVIDYSNYETQIQKLLDKHIFMKDVQPITSLVNIFDKEEFQKEIDKTVSITAKADKIASRTAKHITEHMDEDPAFYKKFSQMIKDAINDYRTKRITVAEYLLRVQNIKEMVLSHTDKDIPEEIFDNFEARAFYGLTFEKLEEKIQDDIIKKTISLTASLEVEKIFIKLIKENDTIIVDWQNNLDINRKAMIEIGDYLIDEIKNKYNINLTYDEIDEIVNRYIEVAKVRYK